MTHSAFATLPAQAQASLVQLSQAIHGVVPFDVKEWTIQVGGLPLGAAKTDLIGQVEEWANKSKLCIYYFECVSPDADLSMVQRVFADAKAHEENDRAYPRLNRPSRFFYVGSSQAVAKRCNEHLGYGAARTYAMQLSHWARSLNLTLRFVCAKYQDNTPYPIVQALEDALWNNKQPMFGRQGRK